MKHLSVLFIAGAMLSGIVAKSQTVDEIVSMHNEAIGGKEAWSKVNSIVLHGVVSANGMDIPVSITKLRNKGMRTDLEAMGGKGFIIITPTAGWQFLPFGNGQTAPSTMSADMVKAQQGEMVVGDDLLTYKERGAKLEYTGKEKLDSTEYFKLSFTDKDGSGKTIYVDPATYFIAREVRKINADGKDLATDRNFRDYQKLPEGIVVAMTMGGNSGETRITKAEINTVKGDSVFKP